jgi:hypothetical protein
MTLQELLNALREQMKEAGVSSTDATANLAFVARRERDGEVEVDFVDAATMSKPRAEELHRLEITLSDVADSPIDMVDEDEDQGEEEGENPLQGGLFKKGKALDSPPAFRHTAKPPSLPPPRKK